MGKLTTAQAAARSDASRFAIHRAIKSGALHPVRDNRGRYLFDAEELDTWADERALLLRADSATEPATDAAQVDVDALRDRLADAEKRAAVAEALAAERLERIEDLRIALAGARWRWPWEPRD